MTSAPAVPTRRISDLLTGLLDKGYAREVRPVLEALSNDPRLRAALDVFEREAARLTEAGLPFTPDNPALRNLTSTVEVVLDRQAGRIDNAGQSLAADAVKSAGTTAKQLALPGVSDAALREIGVAWNKLDPDAVARLVNYANSKAWNDRLGKYGATVADRINKIAIASMIDGQNPRETARQVVNAVNTIPRYEAESMLRTLQLTSHRQAQAANYAANDEIIDHLIRIEALDDRICISCISLHGTRLEVGESPDEHPNGRATAIPVIKGFPRNVQTGEEWFDGLADERQRYIMGDAAYNAWTAGAVTLDDFVEHTTDPVFGPMIQEASLKGILGKDAPQYYQVNYDKKDKK